MKFIPLVAAVTVLTFSSGCGGSSPTAPSSAAPQQQPPSASAPAIDITISKGNVTPTDAELTAKVGQPISVRVSSDTPDVLHVHSTPDHEFEVNAEPNQTFQFTVDVPGRVEVELHKADRTVATIQVHP
jgi:heme/copper-type cytochrome/quinol oxidase subunit 2